MWIGPNPCELKWIEAQSGKMVLYEFVKLMNDFQQQPQHQQHQQQPQQQQTQHQQVNVYWNYLILVFC